VRVLLSSWGSRGDIEPLAALALRLRELGAEVRVCAPPDEEFGALFVRVGLAVIPLGPSTRSIAAGLKAPSPDAAFRLAAELVGDGPGSRDARPRNRDRRPSPHRRGRRGRTDGAAVAVLRLLALGLASSA
jgi:hypothetical protein